MIVISLYMSRVVIAALGVGNFGVYNVVGSVTGSFAMIANEQLFNAASRSMRITCLSMQKSCMD